MVPTYLVETEAKQEEQHVDDLVAHQLASEADHDEHASTHVDPVLGIAAHHQSAHNLQNRLVLPAPLCGRKGRRSTLLLTKLKTQPYCTAHAIRSQCEN